MGHMGYPPGIIQPWEIPWEISSEPNKRRFDSLGKSTVEMLTLPWEMLKKNTFDYRKVERYQLVSP